MKIQIFKIFFILIPAIFILAGCGGNHSDSSAFEAKHKEYPAQEGWNSIYRISRAGRPQAVIRYGHMSQYDKKQTTFFDEGVIVDFYDDTGKHSSKLTSSRGIYNEVSNDIYAIDNVVVVSDTGVALYTEKLRWDQKREKIISDTLVTVVTENSDTLYGLGFESEPDLSRMVFRETRGRTKKRLDFDRIESELSRSPDSDSLSAQKTGGDSL